MLHSLTRGKALDLFTETTIALRSSLLNSHFCLLPSYSLAAISHFSLLLVLTIVCIHYTSRPFISPQDFLLYVSKMILLSIQQHTYIPEEESWGCLIRVSAAYILWPPYLRTTRRQTHKGRLGCSRWHVVPVYTVAWVHPRVWGTCNASKKDEFGP